MRGAGCRMRSLLLPLPLKLQHRRAWSSRGDSDRHQRRDWCCPLRLQSPLFLFISASKQVLKAFTPPHPSCPAQSDSLLIPLPPKLLLHFLASLQGFDLSGYLPISPSSLQLGFGAGRMSGVILELSAGEGWRSCWILHFFHGVLSGICAQSPLLGFLKLNSSPSW